MKRDFKEKVSCLIECIELKNDFINVFVPIHNQKLAKVLCFMDISIRMA